MIAAALTVVTFTASAVVAVADVVPIFVCAVIAFIVFVVTVGASDTVIHPVVRILRRLYHIITVRVIACIENRLCEQLLFEI